MKKGPAVPRKTEKIAQAEKTAKSFRCSKLISDALDAAKNASGRSLSQEIEYRLEMTFSNDRLASGVLEHAFGEAWPMFFAITDAVKTVQAMKDMHSRGLISDKQFGIMTGFQHERITSTLNEIFAGVK